MPAAKGWLCLPVLDAARRELALGDSPVLDAARRELALGQHVVEQEVEQRGDAAAVEENAQLVARRRAA